MSFFDAPWHWVLLLLAALVIFGSSRLPGAAKSLGSSINIFKKAVKSDDASAASGITTQATYVPPPPAQITTEPVSGSQQAQIDDLQRQLSDLQRQQAPSDATPASEAQPHGQSH